MTKIYSNISNPTSAEIIDPSLVYIETYVDKNAVSHFDCDLEEVSKFLLQKGLKKSCKIRVDVHAGDSSMYFNFGNLGSPQRPSSTALTGLVKGKRYWKLRVIKPKVIEYAAYTASNLKEYDVHAPEIEHLFEFKAYEQDMPWNVHLEEDENPIVYLSERIQDLLKEDLQKVANPYVKSLILLPAFVEMLIHLAKNPSDEEDVWQLKWYSWLENQGEDIDDFKKLEPKDDYKKREKATEICNGYAKSLKWIENIENAQQD